MLCLRCELKLSEGAFAVLEILKEATPPLDVELPGCDGLLLLAIFGESITLDERRALVFDYAAFDSVSDWTF